MHPHTSSWSFCCLHQLQPRFAPAPPVPPHPPCQPPSPPPPSPPSPPPLLTKILAAPLRLSAPPRLTPSPSPSHPASLPTYAVRRVVCGGPGAGRGAGQPSSPLRDEALVTGDRTDLSDGDAVRPRTLPVVVVTVAQDDWPSAHRLRCNAAEKARSSSRRRRPKIDLLYFRSKMLHRVPVSIVTKSEKKLRYFFTFASKQRSFVPLTFAAWQVDLSLTFAKGKVDLSLTFAAGQVDLSLTFVAGQVDL